MSILLGTDFATGHLHSNKNTTEHTTANEITRDHETPWPVQLSHDKECPESAVSRNEQASKEEAEGRRVRKKKRNKYDQVQCSNRALDLRYVDIYKESQWRELSAEI